MAASLVLVSVILTGCCGTHAWTGSRGTGLAFQTGNELTDKSHASLLLGSPPLATPSTTTSDLSVCLWLKVLHFRQTTYVFSYATSDKDNNELNFGIKSSGLVMAVGGYYLRTGKSDAATAYMPDEWYHFCFVANSIATTATFYVNGLVVNEVNLTRRSILLNGSLVLGQETDQVGGGYSALQSFSGIITAFNLYSRALSDGEVKALAEECWGKGEDGDLVGWTSASWTLKGSVKQQNLPDDYCSSGRFRFILSPKRRMGKESSELCRKLKTGIAVPNDEQENSQLHQAALPFLSQCQPPNHASAFFIIGASGSPRNGNWTDDEGVSLSYTNFGTISTLKRKRCIGFLVPPNMGEWTDISCGLSYEFCAACQERRPTIVKMRGLCETDLQSTYFRLEHKLREMPAFRGFTKYYISHNTNNTWILLDMWSENVVAKTSVYDQELPLGRRDWMAATDFLLCGLEAGTSKVLSLSACFTDEYTCGDGTCISLSQRCDMRVDCPDNTDETGCEKLVLPDEYMEALPPPAPLPGPLALNLSVSVHSFSQVDIRNMKLTVDFSTVIMWYDQRLDYQNLKPFSDLNYIKAFDVWTPKVELVNADFPEVHVMPAALTVVKLAHPEKDQSSRPQHDERYQGAKNPLRLRQKINAPFSCNMDLREFPFDSQHCQLQLRLSSARQEFLKWHHLHVEYLGEVLLTEYKVGKISGSQGQAEGYSQVSVTINFQRRYSYYFTSTYVPTIMLMLISYASLYVPHDKCDLRVMMALTTLLVLYALYQQISDGLPRTAYVKAIDIWCFFAITFIFSQVIFQVAIGVRVSWLCCVRPSASQVKGLHQPIHHRCLLVVRILYILILLLFCAIYWGVLLT